MEVETVVENRDGEFKMPKKAVKRKIAEAEKVTIFPDFGNCFLILLLF